MWKLPAVLSLQRNFRFDYLRSDRSLHSGRSSCFEAHFDSILFYVVNVMETSVYIQTMINRYSIDQR